MNNFLAVPAPVIMMNKTRCRNSAVFKVFLNVFGGMGAGRKMFVSATRAFVNMNVNVFVYLFGLFSEMSLMTIRCASLLRIFRINAYRRSKRRIHLSGWMDILFYNNFNSSSI
jgi:hypothetical protein